MLYRECERCGASLDLGEKCDCEERDEEIISIAQNDKGCCRVEKNPSVSAEPSHLPLGQGRQEERICATPKWLLDIVKKRSSIQSGNL